MTHLAPQDATRATLAYSETEDRISLTCAISEHRILLWLTSRLLKRLAPPLLAIAECVPTKCGTDETNKVDATISQSMPDLESPVIAAPGDPSFLVSAVDIVNGPMTICLQFRGEDNQGAVRLSLEHGQIANWLQGLRRCFEAATWPLDFWVPDTDSSMTSQITKQVLIH